MWGETVPGNMHVDRYTYFNPLTPCGVRRRCFDVSFKISYFNPLTPCGVRLIGLANVAVDVEFQSTHPVWGETATNRATFSGYQISIHSPRVG